MGVKLKDVDVETWRKAQGADSIITLNAGSVATQLEPLNKKLADEVFGPGSWDLLKKA